MRTRAIAARYLGLRSLLRCGAEVVPDLLGEEAGADPGPSGRQKEIENMKTSIALILCIVGLAVALLACEQPQDSAEELEEAHSGSWPPVLECALHILEPGAASCELYACRDAIASCGEQGYWLGFGQPFCQLFSDVIRPQMSRPGRLWVDITRTCLQIQANRISPSATCEEVFQEATDSHPGCWLHGGYCWLTPADKQILANLPVGPDMAESFAEFIRGLDETCASAP